MGSVFRCKAITWSCNGHSVADYTKYAYMRMTGGRVNDDPVLRPVYAFTPPKNQRKCENHYVLLTRGIVDTGTSAKSVNSNCEMISFRLNCNTLCIGFCSRLLVSWNRFSLFEKNVCSSDIGWPENNYEDFVNIIKLLLSYTFALMVSVYDIQPSNYCFWFPCYRKADFQETRHPHFGRFI